jgi:hypothetical protein
MIFLWFSSNSSSLSLLTSNKLIINILSTIFTTRLSSPRIHLKYNNNNNNSNNNNNRIKNLISRLTHS